MALGICSITDNRPSLLSSDPGNNPSEIYAEDAFRLIHFAGYYMYLDSSASSLRIGEFAIMKSPTQEPSGQMCLTFQYYLQHYSQPSILVWQYFG